MTAPHSWPAPAELVPHRGVALFLRRVVHVSDRSIEATARIPRGHALVRDGLAPCLLAIEAAAQAAAAMEAVICPSDPDIPLAPRAGSLVRIREATFHAATLPVETDLDVTAELVGTAPPLAMYRVRIDLAGTCVADAAISTYAHVAPNRRRVQTTPPITHEP